MNSVHLYHAEHWLPVKGHKSHSAKIGAKQAALSSDNVKMEVTVILNAAMSESESERVSENTFAFRKE